MNDRYKFRAYIKSLKWTVPVSRINFDCETVEVDLTYGNGDIAEYDFDEIILMQYTGLKDKNGVEICEGDILHMGDPKIMYCVEWRDTALNAKQIKSSSWTGLTYWLKWLEVIGNIHDNPELMGVQG